MYLNYDTTYDFYSKMTISKEIKTFNYDFYFFLKYHSRALYDNLKKLNYVS